MLATCAWSRALRSRRRSRSGVPSSRGIQNRREKEFYAGREYSDYEEPGPEYSEDGDEYVDYIVEESDYEDDDLLDYPYDEFEVSESDEINGDELSDSYDGEDEEDDAAARRSRIPDTGDPASGMGALGAGLAAAGVAMAAYSRRRVENERAEQEGVEEEE